MALDRHVEWWRLKYAGLDVLAKCTVKKEGNHWILISPCGNFKEQYTSWNAVLRRLGELK